MPYDPHAPSLLSRLVGAPTPAASAQASADHASREETQAAAGAPPLPATPGAAHDALRAALEGTLLSPLARLEHSLGQIAALLQALQPRHSIRDTLNLDATNGLQINARGREFVGIRSSITTPAIIFQRPSGQTSAITISSAFTYFAAADGARVFAAAGANAGNYEFLYTDTIGGAVPQ